MLPEELSTDKTSLLQGDDRLAIIIEFDVASNGTVTTQDIFRALVHNYSKMSYEVVGNWLDGNAAVPDEVSRVPKLEAQVRMQFDVGATFAQSKDVHREHFVCRRFRRHQS
jgi:exoribonuclease-2